MPRRGASICCSTSCSWRCCAASRFAQLQRQIREIAALLEERHTIPMVAAEMELIQDLLLDEWWQDVTVPMLEEVRRSLRRLVGLIEQHSPGAPLHELHR